MDIQETVSQLKQFRQELYEVFDLRPDALMELIDALSSTPNARSVVELSLSPFFRREYSSVHDAIAHLFRPTEPEKTEEERRAFEQKWVRMIAPYLPEPQQRKFWLFGTDVVPIPRPFARTLADRTFVHQPNTLRGNKPVTIGHDYSHLVFFPEKTKAGDPPWAVPMIVRRVRSDEKATGVGAEQIGTLMKDETLPFHDGLCVHVADSVYSAVTYLGPVAVEEHENLVNVVRSRSNRVFYRQAPPVVGKRGPGHPTWYGERFDLKDPSTWGEPDVMEETTFTTRKGHDYRVDLEGWQDLLMRGKKGLPMHKYPFTLIRVRVLDEEGNPVFKHTLWLIVIGERRNELSLVEAWEAYGQRYDVEHYFRFGKQRLLMASYQTPDVKHEENWMQIMALAHMQLWLARDLAESLPRPWERYLPEAKR
ncbi:MAG: transposase, partial [Anaerolineae bacterium]